MRSFSFPLLFSLALLSIQASASTPAPPKLPPAPKFTVGDPTRIKIRGTGTYYINDSVFPWMPTQDGTAYMALWGDGSVKRYTGPDFDNLQPPPQNAASTYTTAAGVTNSWRANGIWMLTATRIADGSLVAFVHGEDHSFINIVKPGEWNSTGVWTSDDDGLTWTDHGEALGSKKPDTSQNGGLAMNEVIWDEANERWLGYSGAHIFTSSDPHALPGSWYGYYKGAFTQHIDVTAPAPSLTVAPGFENTNVTWGGMTYNYYLHQYIKTWTDGAGAAVHMAFSPDGIRWGGVTQLFSESPNKMSYGFIVGDTDTRSGQDCYLIYMRSPASGKTESGNVKDMIRRPIHFERVRPLPPPQVTAVQ